jgi:GntR family transcriptional regulator
MDFREEQPIYLQIADYVCEKILLKKWEQGDRVPSVRELAVELAVNPNTVMRTYELLQEEDIVFNQRGVGLFVSVSGMKNAREYRRTQFMKKELPAFFKSMTLLQISIEELEELLKQKKKSKN